jgi:hypothetical protein
MLEILEILEEPMNLMRVIRRHWQLLKFSRRLSGDNSEDKRRADLAIRIAYLVAQDEDMLFRVKMEAVACVLLDMAYSAIIDPSVPASIEFRSMGRSGHQGSVVVHIAPTLTYAPVGRPS